MYLSNKHLLLIYAFLNRKWFSNRLPKDMPVMFAKMKALGDTTVHPQTKRPLAIRVNDKLRWSDALAMGTLLHEMVHVANPSRRGHGYRFNRDMLKLAKRGAFNLFW